MALDYGKKRIGVALSDPLGIMANPLCVVHREGSRQKDLQSIADLIAQHEVATLVMGLPLNMDGTPGIIVDEVREFARLLGELANVRIEFVDERLTTAEAERMLTDEADLSREKRKGVRDKIAASFILESYLNSRI